MALAKQQVDAHLVLEEEVALVRADAERERDRDRRRLLLELQRCLFTFILLLSNIFACRYGACMHVHLWCMDAYAFMRSEKRC